MPRAKKKPKSAIVQFPSDRLPTLEAVMKWVRRNKSKLKGHPIGMTSLQWKTYEYALSGKTALYAGGIPVVVNEDHEEKV